MDDQGTSLRASAAAQSGPGMKILIAEDERTSQLLLRNALEQQGHEVLLAEDGDQAWSLFQESGAHVVISDWVMPGMDGDEFCRRVRDRPGGGYTYFILLTSLDGFEHALEGMRAGADDYLTKPLDREQLAMRLIAASRVTDLHRELDRLTEELRLEARTDALTRVGNRLCLGEDLEQLSARVDRYGHSYSLALFDVDGFKAYNDTRGHQDGDDVLRAVTKALVDASRSGDRVYRFGGEEFLVVLPEQDLECAAGAADRMRSAVEALAIHHPGTHEPPCVTVSCGVAALEGDAGSADPEELLKRADAALYKAKETGRNCVAVDRAPAQARA